MARRPEVALPSPDSQSTSFVSQHFIDEQRDERVYNNFIFEFCTFEKIGLKGTVFNHCTFKHCEFIDCYLAHSKFEHCRFTGSFFDRCVFSWASFPNTGLDYTNFSECGPVLSQIQEHKPRDPQAAAKLFRNLASEHKKLGNWEQVDKYIMASYRERERHFNYVITGKNDFYKRKYSGMQRFTYIFRWIGSKLAGSILGYGVSWTIFARSVLIFGLVVFPIINAIFGSHIRINGDIYDQSLSSVGGYLGDLYAATIRAFFPFVPAPVAELNFALPFWLSSAEAAFGTTMMAVFAAMLFRWASKGV